MTPRAILPLLALLLVAAPARAEEVVTFKTKDRLKIEADLFPAGAKGAPGVVALHMYPADRTSWRPVARRFAEAGIDFLAVDMRGYGGSAKQGRRDLSEAVKKRDPKLFRKMYQDALAAYAYLVSRGTDPERVAFLGASVGCSVAIDAAAREPRIRGACVMTPGKAYLGVETMRHLKDWGDRPMLVLSSKEEAAKGAEPIHDALGESAELVLFDGTGIHGTQMFGKVAGVEERIVGWFADLLGAPVALDGKVSMEEARGARNLGSWDLRADGNAELYAGRRGRHLYVALRLTGPGAAPERLYFAWAPEGKREGARRVACTFGRKGGTFVLEELSGGWSPVRRAIPKDARLGVSSTAGIELMLPLGEEPLGLVPGTDLKVSFGFARKSGDNLRAIPMGDGGMTAVDRWIDFSLKE